MNVVFQSDDIYRKWSSDTSPKLEFSICFLYSLPCLDFSLCSLYFLPCLKFSICSLYSLPCLAFPVNVSLFSSNDLLASATDGDFAGGVDDFSRVAELVNLDGSS